MRTQSKNNCTRKAVAGEVRVEAGAVESSCTKRGRDPEGALCMWLALNCSPGWKKCRNAC